MGAASPSLAADPIALEILWTRLIAIADEAATTLVRTSFSPIVRESNDFSCVLFDRAGNAIAENTIGIPSFNLTMSRTLAHLLRWRPAERWRPGDVACTNDPWLTSGHLPDLTVLAPVFREGRLLAWTGSIAHQADIGGTIWSADTREVYEEGIRVPPILLCREGELNEDLLELLRANLRLPDQVVGDVMAQVAAGETAARRLLELVDEAGLDDLDELSHEVCTRAERAMRRAVAAISDGVYRGSLDLDGTGEEAVHLEATVHVRGDALDVDYTGTSPQVGRSLNVVLNYTEAYTCYPLKCALDPATPRNEGSYRCLGVTAPEGTILNPRRPAAVNARQLVGHCLSAVLYTALAPVLGDRVIAESGSAPTLRVVLSGPRDPGGPGGSPPGEQGRRFTSIFFLNGGMGARPEHDGLSTTCFPSNVICGAMESIEATAPVRVWRKELAVDSGGPGRQRGGLGQELEVELLAPAECTLSLFVEHAEHPPQGVLGGRPGAPSAVVWNGSSAGFPLKGRSRIRPGDRLWVRYPGGGGYGDPAERDRDAVSADLEAGLVTEAQARDEYRWR
ncbi:MAG: hydantoinase B/oxoprolinase family protein [Candidatus Dormibacteraeota bacterium]|nr:hydantoinase B/oxoprolinase family protein [Candidatus Dormibacteraeota bacterium]MBO0706028.1 hydantoinase B/oxoprolinase family protein [Candidatus Dormibacteraeota bacterium]MBO0760236.1 hydantoinase B/oxoprolinase family protein [Candidatus Dormibacteraeota bacterium]